MDKAQFGGTTMANMYQLYWRAGSGSMVAEAALRMAGVAFVPRNVAAKADQQKPEFLAINPAGKIPVLVLPGGQVVFESMAIVLAIDERFPQRHLLPPILSAERATALQWLAFLACQTYPAALRFWYPQRHTADPSEAAIAAVKAQAAADLDRDFALICAALKGPFLLGDTLTIVDVYAAMIADWHDPATLLPAMQRLKAAMLAHDPVRVAWENHAFGTW
ncbi:MAG: glutathione S-transferase family protein [Phyllobacteriaceae bacterium]|nr:glutathione S-transferase family protein [Phyllobacteriaceae bacterium]